MQFKKHFKLWKCCTIFILKTSYVYCSQGKCNLTFLSHGNHNLQEMALLLVLSQRTNKALYEWAHYDISRITKMRCLAKWRESDHFPNCVHPLYVYTSSKTELRSFCIILKVASYEWNCHPTNCTISHKTFFLNKNSKFSFVLTCCSKNKYLSMLYQKYRSHVLLSPSRLDKVRIVGN